MDYHGLSWINGSWIMDYHGLLWIIVVHCGLSWILEYAPPWNRPWSIVDYLGLSLMIMDHGLWRIMMDYGLSWIIVDKWGFLWIMYYHGLVDYCGTLWTIVDS